MIDGGIGMKVERNPGLRYLYFLADIIRGGWEENGREKSRLRMCCASAALGCPG